VGAVSCLVCYCSRSIDNYFHPQTVSTLGIFVYSNPAGFKVLVQLAYLFSPIQLDSRSWYSVNVVVQFPLTQARLSFLFK